MACCHHYDFIEGNERVFAVDPSAIRFGPGALAEIGHDARGLGLERVALFTDRGVAGLEAVATVRSALTAAGVDVAVYDEVDGLLEALWIRRPYILGLAKKKVSDFQWLNIFTVGVFLGSH